MSEARAVAGCDDGRMSAAGGEGVDVLDEIGVLAEVDKLCAEGLDELLFLLATVDADDAAPGGEAVLYCVLAQAAARADDEEVVIGLEGRILDGFIRPGTSVSIVSNNSI